MIIFIKLLLAHLLGYFLLQPSKWVVDKETKKHKSSYLYIHILLHGILAWILVGEIQFGWFAVVLALLHGLIEFLKLILQKTDTKRIWFIIDQILHALVIVSIVSVYKNLTPNLDFFYTLFWILVTGIFFLTSPTSITIKNAISVWTPEHTTEK